MKNKKLITAIILGLILALVIYLLSLEKNESLTNILQNSETPLLLEPVEWEPNSETLQLDLFEEDRTNSLDTKEDQDAFYCFNGSPKNANYVMLGNGQTLYVKFTGANWSNVRNTCGNYVPANNRFTFGNGTYQYQMVLFADAPGARYYYTLPNNRPMCEESILYSLETKRGFKYYIYTNDTRGDHPDNRGYISYCVGAR